MNINLGWISGWVLGVCRLGPFIQLIKFFFESVSLYTTVISETVFQF